LISTPFINQKETEKLSKQAYDLVEQYENNEVTKTVYINNFSSISYKIARNNGIYSIITILFEIIYYVVLQVKWNGQTIGKKIMKLKVVSENGDLEVNQMIFRTFIANFILLNIISFVLMLFSPKSIYFYVVSSFEFIQYLITFISILMVMYSKKGLSIHDKIAHTMVVGA
jgi:uncharacterized RDD family membrane protein YckC